jgi:membrane-bound ClpP family serine protease
MSAYGFIAIAIFITATGVFAEDYRTRSVHSWLLWLLGALGILFSLTNNAATTVLVNSVINLLFVVSCFYFSPIHFLLYFIASLSFVLLLHTLCSRLRSEKTIALAGWQALLLGCLVIASWLTNYNLSEDLSIFFVRFL